MVDYMIHEDIGTEIDSKATWQKDTLHAIPNQEQGDVLIVPDATHSPTVIHHGNAGDVLMSGGHGADPSWGRRIIDRLSGITPTIPASTWDSDPTDLDHATDGNWATATGLAGQNAVAGYSMSAGYIMVDLGAVYNVWIRGLITIGNGTAWAGVSLYTAASEDNSTYYGVGGDSNAYGNIRASSNASTSTIFLSEFARARYIRLYVMNTTGSTQNLSLGINELQAIDFGV
jgi:hypothetical protein